MVSRERFRRAICFPKTRSPNPGKRKCLFAAAGAVATTASASVADVRGTVMQLFLPGGAWGVQSRRPRSAPALLQ